MKQGHKWIIGIDEAGRGPLAGPVSVGVVCVPSNFDWELLPGVDDSKKLSEKKRAAIFKEAKRLSHTGELTYSVSLESAGVIDAIGIVGAVKKAMEQSLSLLQKKLSFDPATCLVKLDGSLYAPERFVHQETIIRGDSKEKVIGLASIMAKVTRDAYMEKIGKESPYERYIFDVHKGYGTKKHREAIKAYGLCDIHRITFCSKLLKH